MKAKDVDKALGDLNGRFQAVAGATRTALHVHGPLCHDPPSYGQRISLKKAGDNIWRGGLQPIAYGSLASQGPQKQATQPLNCPSSDMCRSNKRAACSRATQLGARAARIQIGLNGPTTTHARPAMAGARGHVNALRCAAPSDRYALLHETHWLCLCRFRVSSMVDLCSSRNGTFYVPYTTMVPDLCSKYARRSIDLVLPAHSSEQHAIERDAVDP